MEESKKFDKSLIQSVTWTSLGINDYLSFGRKKKNYEWEFEYKTAADCLNGIHVIRTSISNCAQDKEMILWYDTTV